MTTPVEVLGYTSAFTQESVQQGRRRLLFLQVLSSHLLVSRRGQATKPLQQLHPTLLIGPQTLDSVYGEAGLPSSTPHHLKAHHKT